MPRQPRLQFPGATYHVATRGVDSECVFRDTFDRRRFLLRLRAVVLRYGWRCLAYCLMGTHYHLLVATPKPNLADGMQRLNGGYAREFNGRHGRRGHLFGARYGSLLVETDEHLLATARYLVLNPVRAGLCEAADEWPWSSYRATAGLAAAPAFLAAGDLLGLIGGSREAARSAYRRFAIETEAA